MATASFVIICRAYLYYKTTEVLHQIYFSYRGDLDEDTAIVDVMKYKAPWENTTDAAKTGIFLL